MFWGEIQGHIKIITCLSFEVSSKIEGRIYFIAIAVATHTEIFNNKMKLLLSHAAQGFSSTPA